MEIEKLRHLLEHWIEHNEEHISKYVKWAERVEPERPEVSRLILESVELFREGNEKLKKLKEMI